MSIRLGVVMDPIESIKAYKDSTLAMLLAAQARGWDIQYMQPFDLWSDTGHAWAEMRPLTVSDDNDAWYRLGPTQERPLTDLDVVLMRVDPPYNMEYIYTTYALQLATREGVRVVNDPRSLRAFSEKLQINWFEDLCPPTLVSARRRQVKRFLQTHKDIILKPLDGMGGQSIFRLREGDPNTSVILETMTRFDRTTVMAQRYIPAIAEGDKRILMIDGEAFPYALARIPGDGETRGNLAAGGRGEGRPLSDRDHEISRRVGPFLKENGILFAGLDVIGDYLTEINITSPTCIRELDAIYHADIGGRLMDVIAQQLHGHGGHGAIRNDE